MNIRWVNILCAVMIFYLFVLMGSWVVEIPRKLRNGLYPAVWTVQQSVTILDKRMGQLVEDKYYHMREEFIYQECRP